MTSPLSGSLAKVVAKAFKNVFLPATLTRGSTVYPCKAINTKTQLFNGPGSLLTTPDYTILVLAKTLAVNPLPGDVMTVQGVSTVILSMSSLPAVSGDPAGATWTLLGNLFPVQSTLYGEYAAIAGAIGTPFAVYRSTGSNPIVAGNLVATLPAAFTPAKAAGFSFTKNLSATDETFAVLTDGTVVKVGDYMVGASTYYVAAMPALQDIVAVLCPDVVTITRPGNALSPTGGAAPGQPSQPGSTGTAWGVSPKIITNPNAEGMTVVVSGIPANTSGTTGRATGAGELPTDSPGPSRWKIYLPPSACPQGSVFDRDIITDQDGARYQVSANVWTPLGYIVQCIKLEN